MNPRTISIFVRRHRGAFHASSSQAVSVNGESATLAARACAAAHYNVAEDRIELTAVNDHVLIAAVKPPRVPFYRRFRYLGVLPVLSGPAPEGVAK